MTPIVSSARPRIGLGVQLGAVIAIWSGLSLASPVQAQSSGPRPLSLPQLPVDGVAAVIGASGAGPNVDVILRSDVELRARILLSGQRGRVVDGPISSFWLAQALEQMIDESLIAREAERVRLATPTALDQQQEHRHLQELAGGAQQLSAVLALMRVSQAELEQTVRRRTLVAVFLTANVDRMTAVTEAELQRAYDAAREHLEGRTFEQSREMIRVQLARAAMQETVAQWVRKLRGRTTVHVVADYLGREQGL